MILFVLITICDTLFNLLIPACSEQSDYISLNEYYDISETSNRKFTGENLDTDFGTGNIFTGDDTPDPNVEYSSEEYYYDTKTTGKEDIPAVIKFIKILLNGTADELKRTNKDTLVQHIKVISRIQMGLSKKLILWEMIKDNKNVRIFRMQDLKNAGDILLTIPEVDLFNLNYLDRNITNYIGTLPGLTRRRTGIAAFALKKIWGEDILTKIDFINEMKGLICGFPPHELVKISTVTFLLIDSSVFENIRSCTRRQLQVLLYIAMKSTAYGPPQAWSKNDTSKLGLLLKAMKPEDLKTIRPEAMEGVNYLTIEAMKTEQLEVLNQDQLSYLSDLSLAAYRRLTGIDSNDTETIGHVLKYFIFMDTLILSLNYF